MSIFNGRGDGWKTKCRLLNEYLNCDRMSKYSTRFIGSNLVHIPDGEEVFIARMEETNSVFYRDMKRYCAYHKENNFRPTNCDKCLYFEECTSEGKNMVEVLKNDNVWKAIIDYYKGE